MAQHLQPDTSDDHLLGAHPSPSRRLTIDYTAFRLIDYPRQSAPRIAVPLHHVLGWTFAVEWRGESRLQGGARPACDSMAPQ